MVEETQIKVCIRNEEVIAFQAKSETPYVHRRVFINVPQALLQAHVVSEEILN